MAGPLILVHGPSCHEDVGVVGDARHDVVWSPTAALIKFTLISANPPAREQDRMIGVELNRRSLEDRVHGRRPPGGDSADCHVELPGRSH